MTDAGGDIAANLAEVLSEVRAVARRAGRDDIGSRIASEVRRARDSEVAVLVAGLPGTGKTSLINALAAARALPDTGSTRVPTLLRKGPPSAIVHLATGPRLENLSSEEVRAWILGEATDTNRTAIAVELWHPAPALPEGLVLVDSPPISSAATARKGIAEAVAWRADALILVTSAGAPLSSEEIAFIRRATASVATTYVAVNRIDRHRGWRQVCSDNLALLPVPESATSRSISLHGVSARLELLALNADGTTADKELAAEGGVEELRVRLVGDLVAERSALRLANLLRAGATALDDVERALRETQTAIAEGEDRAVRAARRTIEEMKTSGDEAQILLRDGFSSLREAASTGLARIARDFTAQARAAKDHEALELLADELENMLAEFADEFEQRAITVVAAAEGLRVGQAVAHPPTEFTGWSPADAAAAAEGGDPLRLRVARSAVSGGMGMALAAQRMLGGGDVLSGLLAVGAVLGAATGVFAIRSAKRNQDLATARRGVVTAIDDARLSAQSALRQRALVRQREAEAILKQHIRLDLEVLQAQVEESVRAAKADALERSRASAAAAREMEKLSAVRARLEALASAAESAQRSKP